MQNLRVMENRLDSVQRQLGNTMFGIAEETDQSLGLIQAKPRVSKMKKEMQAQILTSLNAELVKNIELTKFSIDREQPVIEVLDVPRLPLPKTGKGRLKGALIWGLAGFIGMAILIIFKSQIKF